MTPPTDPERYKNHRFPGEIISHGVWLYYRNHRKTPSFSYGDIRWCLRSRQSISSEVRGVTMKPLALAMGRSHRFPLSYRDVQELLLERRIDVTHEAIRQWCLKFVQDYANRLKRRRAQPGDKWHLDEVFLTINGERHYLWRAVDQDDNVLDILVQSRRNRQAARKVCRELPKELACEPRVGIRCEP